MSPERWWEQESSRATRVIPVLLLQNGGFVKTVNFKNPVYLGDPINIVKIFNEKRADELFILDITATKEGRKPDFDLLSKIAGECFMPLAYGGGIRSLEDIKTLTSMGFEKVSINTCAVKSPEMVRSAAAEFGSSTIVASIDVGQTFWGSQRVYVRGGRERTRLDPVEAAQRAQACGAGELLLTSISRDGTMQGYDINLIRRVSSAVDIPVVACGGAASYRDLADAVLKGGASATAAGSLFVFHGRHRAVLINMPCDQDLAAAELP